MSSKKHHQDSGNVGKPDYIFGHQFGIIGLLAEGPTTDINLYGKNETVQYLCLDLLWRPIGRKVRFVLVKTGEKMMILMCSELTLDPEKIILAYSYRFKIEVSFRMLKHVIGSFRYHFWTKTWPKLSRFKMKTDLSAIKKWAEKEQILATTRAIEVFAFLSCIAMGIMTIIKPNINMTLKDT